MTGEGRLDVLRRRPDLWYNGPGREDRVKVIGDRLRLLREERGLNQSELGRLSGVARSQISRIEKEERPGVGAVMIAQIARALGTTSDYLIGLTDDPSLPTRFDWQAHPDQLRRLQRLVERLARLPEARQRRVMDGVLMLIEASEEAGVQESDQEYLLLGADPDQAREP